MHSGLHPAHLGKGHRYVKELIQLHHEISWWAGEWSPAHHLVVMRQLLIAGQMTGR